MTKEEILFYIDEKIKNLNIKELENYEKYIGPGFSKKIKRAIFAPRIVLKNKLDKIILRTNKKNFKLKVFDSNTKTLLYFIKELNSLNELRTIKFLVKNLTNNDIFYDIGAEVGLYTALALEFCKEVHSFEPIPYNVEVLRKRFGNFKNVYINEVALADYVGKVNFCLGPTTLIEEIKNLYLDKNKQKEIIVQTTTFDEYLKDHKKPTFIKMDVEGAEHLIIKGGYNFFKENNPILVVEILGDEFLENSMKTVNLLKALDYKAYKLNLNGDLELFNYEDFKFAKGVYNYVFKK